MCRPNRMTTVPATLLTIAGLFGQYTADRGRGRAEQGED